MRDTPFYQQGDRELAVISSNIGKLRALGAKIDCVEENDEPPIRQIG